MKRFLAPALVAIFPLSITAAPLKTAIVTTVVKDVKMSENRAAPRSIGEGTKMTGASTILTGNASRAAMTFPDRTVTRVGANSVFRFRSGSRDMEIAQGSFLLQVPKNSGGAKIRTATVTAAITGTTTLMEFSPGKYIKFICLEGTAELINRKGEKVSIPAGYMLVMHPDDESFPVPVQINIEKTMKTALLADRGIFGDLDEAAKEAIDRTIAAQREGRINGDLHPSGLINRGPGKENGYTRSLMSELFYVHGSNGNEQPPPSAGGGGFSGGNLSPGGGSFPDTFPNNP
ncbi:FecR domain-containing protein [Akkermansiaceae bacterium]|nr:FecR domain-containing protein [Akkermansiaceae bacterium]